MHKALAHDLLLGSVDPASANSVCRQTMATIAVAKHADLLADMDTRSRGLAEKISAEEVERLAKIQALEDQLATLRNGV